MIRICIADDQLLVQAAIKAILVASGLFDIAGEANDSHSAIELIATAKPDVLVLSVSLPSGSWIKVVKACLGSRTAVLLVALREGMEQQVCEAMREGAAGFVDDESSGADLIRAIQEIATGKLYCSKKLSGKIRKWPLFLGNPASSLTKRELQVLERAAVGETSREIAKRLGINRRTVESHRASVMRKIGARGQTELIRYATRNHLLIH